MIDLLQSVSTCLIGIALLVHMIGHSRRRGP